MELDPKGRGGQQAQVAQARAGGFLVGHLGVAGPNAAGPLRFEHPAIFPQGLAELVRLSQQLNVNVHCLSPQLHDRHHGTAMIATSLPVRERMPFRGIRETAPGLKAGGPEEAAERYSTVRGQLDK
jgi:hypothetical protein